MQSYFRGVYLMSFDLTLALGSSHYFGYHKISMLVYNYLAKSNPRFSLSF
jgi:hypothetical protein